jgi:DedD protein
MSLSPDNPAGASTAANASTSSDQLATVVIGSRRPRDVETDPDAGKTPAPTTVKIGSGDSASQPVIAQRHAASASEPPAAAPKPASKAPEKAAVKAPAQTAAVAAAPKPKPAKPAAAPATGHGSYTLNLSAYASASGAARLQRRVRALGYSVGGYAITQAGQNRTLVIAGPFETRAAAEAARLKITQSIPGVPARLEQDASPDKAASSAPASSSKAGGYAVQLAAVSTQADANALRDKLRAKGFDGFVDSVQSGGKKLWRVRAGPQTQRADAQRVHDQIKAKLGIDGNVVTVP